MRRWLDNDAIKSWQHRSWIFPRDPGFAAKAGRVLDLFEYRRGGTLAYLAALDVHQAKGIGRCAPTTGIEPFRELVEQVMTQEPYASARRVFWVVDNGSSHAGQVSIERMSRAWPNAERLGILPTPSDRTKSDATQGLLRVEVANLS